MIDVVKATCPQFDFEIRLDQDEATLILSMTRNGHQWGSESVPIDRAKEVGQELVRLAEESGS